MNQLSSSVVLGRRPVQSLVRLKFLAALLAGSSAAFAAGVTWSGSTNTNFETGTNWGGTAPTNDASTDYAIFTGAPAANQPTLTANRSIGGLQFGATGGWTLSGNFTLALGSALTVGSTTGVGIDASALTSGTDTITSAINLANAQTWLVGTGGTLSVNNVSHPGSALAFTAGDTANAGTIILGGTTDDSYLGVIVANGVVELGKTSSGSVHALGSNSTINGGTLRLAGTGGDQIFSGASLAVNGGTFDLNGRSESFGQLTAAAVGGTTTNTSGTASTLTTTSGGIYAGAFSGNLSIITTGGATFSGAINNTGTITNSGTATLTISGNLGANVTGVIQNNAASTTVLSGTNSAYAGGITITAGTLRADANSATTLGSGAIILGDGANTGNAATLNINATAARTYSNAISTTGTGLATINLSNYFATFTNAVVMGSNLALTTTNTNNSTLAFSGSISGTGNLITQVGGTNSGSAIILSGALINNIGTITNSGTGQGGTTISAVIGSNVTQVIQNSANSSLTLSGANTYGQTIVQAGLAKTTSLGRFGVGNVTVFNGAFLMLGNSASIGDTATLLFGNTATIDLNGQAETLAGLFNTSTSTSFTVAGTYTAGQLNTQFGGINAFIGGGSIIISPSAIPEPSTYAAIFGVLALGGVCLKRRRWYRLSDQGIKYH